MKSWLEIVKQENIDLDFISLHVLISHRETINDSDEKGDTPLKIAIHRKLAGFSGVSSAGLDLIDMLIDLGAKVTEEMLEDLYPNDLDLLSRILQRAILEELSHHKEAEVLLLLFYAQKFIGNSKALLNEMCLEDGRFPLHIAIEMDNEKLMYALLRAQAFPGVREGQHLSPLAFARRSNFKLFYKMIVYLLCEYPVTDKKWLSKENDYILEEMLQALSTSFSSVTFYQEYRKELAELYTLAITFEKSEFTRILLKLGKTLSSHKVAELKAEIFNLDPLQRSYLSQLFWRAKYRACQLGKGELGEIASRLTGSALSPLCAQSMFYQNWKKKYACLDFKEFEMPTCK